MGAGAPAPVASIELTPEFTARFELSVDEDAELVEVEYLDGDIEELDIDTWHELDLERIEEPEGWSGGDEEEDEEEDEDLDEDDEDDDWDDDDDDDDDEDDDWEDDEEDSDRY